MTDALPPPDDPREARKIRRELRKSKPLGWRALTGMYGGTASCPKQGVSTSPTGTSESNTSPAKK